MKHVLLIFSSLLLFTATMTAQKRGNLPPCADHSAFYNTTVTVEINVSPAAHMDWKFPEAPSVVAERILSGLNDNNRLIKFKEPNGMLPNFIINVTMTETNQGTRRDQASAELVGPPEGSQLGAAGSGTILFETSGDAPYTNWTDAVDHLSKNLVDSFKRGWLGLPPCIQADGSVRKKSN
jgi:hypothetical protein